jgi:hypothetical protein
MKAPESTEIDIPQWMRANEWKLWLMIWPLKALNNANFSLREVMEFIYVELFGKSYDPVLSTRDFSYLAYARSLMNEMIAANEEDVYFSKSLPNDAKALWSEIIKRRLKYMI